MSDQEEIAALKAENAKLRSLLKKANEEIAKWRRMASKTERHNQDYLPYSEEDR